MDITPGKRNKRIRFAAILSWSTELIFLFLTVCILYWMLYFSPLCLVRILFLFIGFLCDPIIFLRIFGERMQL